MALLRFYFIFVYIFTLLQNQVTFSITAVKEARITGGQETKKGQFSCAAAITVQTNNSRFFCGGTIIKPIWIITSGVCVNNAVLFTIQVGSNTLEGDDSDRVNLTASDYIVHPNFNAETLESDIGLIKLDTPLTYTDFVRPAYISYFFIREGEPVVSIGWGQTSDSDDALSNTLKYVETKALSNEECKSYYGNQITDGMVCAAGDQNEGTCTGDTGSALLVKYTDLYINGVASFISGNGCGSGDPSGYTRILPYATWLLNVTEV